MAVAKDHTDIIKKLKAQVKLIQKKEELGRQQLHTAFDKIHKLGTVFKKRLAKNILVMQDKVMSAQASSYAKIASDFEHKILKGIKKKTLAVAAAINKLEKKHKKNGSVKATKRSSKVRSRK